MEHQIEHSRGAAEGPDRQRTPLTGASPAAYDGYDAAIASAAVQDRTPRGILVLAGPDAVPFLHGILTNDIRSLHPGQACYAAYLTPQGRMVADMDVLRRADDLILDTEPHVVQALASRLDDSLFTEDVRIVNLSDQLSSLAIYGPQSSMVLERVLPSGSPLAALDPDHHLSVDAEYGELTLLRVRRRLLDGLHVFGSAAGVAQLAAALRAADVALLGGLAAESLRIESAIPRFGTDMTDDTIPLEAGIEGRAISTTKGCYVGQEVIVRILHRGHGRVVRKLVQLEIAGDVPAAGTKLLAGEREVGQVTSAVRSPRAGVVALGYVHRDFLGAGTTLQLAGSAHSAVVSDPEKGPGGPS